MITKLKNIVTGFLIILAFYYFSRLVLDFLNIQFPPAILGLVLFALSLISGFVKEVWIKDAVDLLMKNMAMFLLPFWGGLVVYESLLKRNAVLILLVVLLTTTIIIVCTGIFVEQGLKYTRWYKMNKGRCAGKND